MRWLGLLAAFVCLIGATVALTIWGRTSAPTMVATPPKTTPGATQGSVDTLTRQVERLRTELAATTHASRTETAGVAEADEGTTPPRIRAYLEKREEAMARHQRNMATLQQSLESDIFDASTESSVQRAVEELVKSGTVPGATMADVDCRISLCKVTFAHDSVESQQAAIPQLLCSDPFSDSRLIYWGFESEGGLKTILYMSRPHGVLPELSRD